MVDLARYETKYRHPDHAKGPIHALVWIHHLQNLVIPRIRA